MVPLLNLRIRVGFSSQQHIVVGFSNQQHTLAGFSSDVCNLCRLDNPHKSTPPQVHDSLNLYNLSL